MVVKIRLARFGRKNAPFYNIVVTQARTARNSRPMEVIGTYEPVPQLDPYQQLQQQRSVTARSARSAQSATETVAEQIKPHKDVKLDVTRARYWIGVGAQPTEPVWRLLSMVGVLPAKRKGTAALQTAGAAAEANSSSSPAQTSEAAQ